jgi:hypothetical protein
MVDESGSHKKVILAFPTFGFISDLRMLIVAFYNYYGSDYSENLVSESVTKSFQYFKSRGAFIWRSLHNNRVNEAFKTESIPYCHLLIRTF